MKLGKTSGDHQLDWDFSPGNMTGCTKLHGNQSNTSQNIAVWTKVIDKMTNSQCFFVFFSRKLNTISPCYFLISLVLCQ